MRPEVEFAAKLVSKKFAGEDNTPSDMLRIEVEAKGNAITIWEC